MPPASTLLDLVVLAIGRLGGAVRRSDLLAEVDRLFGGAFTAEDREPVRTRQYEESWRNRASCQRANVVRERLLVNRADGIWELAQLGRNHLDAISGTPSAPALHNPILINPLRNFAPKDSPECLAHVAGRVLIKSRGHEALIEDYGRWRQRSRCWLGA